MKSIIFLVDSNCVTVCAGLVGADSFTWIFVCQGLKWKTIIFFQICCSSEAGCISLFLNCT